MRSDAPSLEDRPVAVTILRIYISTRRLDNGIFAHCDVDGRIRQSIVAQQ